MAFPLRNDFSQHIYNYHKVEMAFDDEDDNDIADIKSSQINSMRGDLEIVSIMITTVGDEQQQ